MNWAKFTNQAKTKVGLMSGCSDSELTDVSDTFFCYIDFCSIKRMPPGRRQVTVAAGRACGILGPAYLSSIVRTRCDEGRNFGIAEHRIAEVA